jgi:hypothetical protein
METYPSPQSPDESHRIAIDLKRSAWSRCYPEFLLKFRRMGSLFNLSLRNTFKRFTAKRKVCAVRPHPLTQNPLTVRVQKFKIISAFIYHKRI